MTLGGAGLRIPEPRFCVDPIVTSVAEPCLEDTNCWRAQSWEASGDGSPPQFDQRLVPHDFHQSLA